MTKSFRVVDRSPLLESFVFDVERRTIEHDGTTFERDVVTHQGAVAILAINDADEVGFIRQYRAPFDAFVLEIPAGTMDHQGEEPLATAKRELREELGCDATSWTLLGRFMVSPGWTNQVMNIFEARGITTCERAPEGPEETSASIEWIAIAKIQETLEHEPMLDYTLSVAMHRVFGTFLERN